MQAHYKRSVGVKWLHSPGVLGEMAFPQLWPGSREVELSLTPNQHGWPDELDVLNAAPRYHDLLLENEAVCVLDR